MPKRSVPTRKDWGDLKDLDVRYAHKLFGGKTIEQALPHFINSPIERSSELLYAPAKVFNYYIQCFVTYLTSEASREESDAASTFLELIRGRLSKPGASEVAATILKIKPAIDQIAGRQSFYDADPNIYGSFIKIKNEIETALKPFEGQ